MGANDKHYPTQPRVGTEYTPRSFEAAKAAAIGQEERDSRPDRPRIQPDEIRYMSLLADKAEDVGQFLDLI